MQDNQTYAVAAEELKSFIERIEAGEAERQEAADRIKEIYAEAKGRGYDTKVVKKIVALRKRDSDDVSEEEAILEMYKSALGMV